MPTRQGWGALGAGLGSVFAGRVFALIELYVVGAALVIAVALAMLVVRRPLPRLEARRGRTVVMGRGSASGAGPAPR